MRRGSCRSGTTRVTSRADGAAKVTDKGIKEDFAQDLPMSEREVLAATQGPTNGAALGGKVSVAAWKTKPTSYVVATEDRMIPPDLAHRFAKAMNAKTIVLASSHVPMLSHPVEVADLIIQAASARHSGQ